MTSRLFAIALTVSFLSVCNASDRAAVAERHVGVALRDKDEVVLLPGEVVTVLQSRSDSSLVDSEHRGTIGGVWIPNRKLVIQSSFRRVREWKGEKDQSVDAGDYSAEYSFYSDGSFRLLIGIPDKKGRYPTVRGHLYQSGQMVWARINGSDAMRKEHVFIIRPNNSLCWVVSLDDCNAP